jgi:hypothetical protein
MGYSKIFRRFSKDSLRKIVVLQSSLFYNREYVAHVLQSLEKHGTHRRKFDHSDVDSGVRPRKGCRMHVH